jgi:hypothetical protein
MLGIGSRELRSGRWELGERVAVSADVWDFVQKWCRRKKRKKRTHSIGIPLKGISKPVFSGDIFRRFR